MADWNEKPLADAKRRIRDQARAQRKLAERYQAEVQAFEAGIPIPPAPAPMTGAEYAAAVRVSLDQHTKAVEAVRVLFERVVARSTTANLQRLEAALSLYMRSLERR